MVVVAGFHVGVRGKAAGRVVRCGAKPGGCRLMGADGGPVPHFASLDEGERWLAEQEAAQRGGFAGGSGDADDGVRDAFAPDSGFVVDAAGRFYRDNGEAATCVSGADVAQWGGADNSSVDIIDGGGKYALNADDGLARVLSGVNGGTVGGRFRAVDVYGCMLGDVAGNARLNQVGDYGRGGASETTSYIGVLSGEGHIVRLANGCIVGSVTGSGKVTNVAGSVGVVSGSGSVASVHDGGRVGGVIGRGIVGSVGGVGATVGVVGGGVPDGPSDGVVRNVAGGGHVESVTGHGVVELVKSGGSVGVVDGNGSVRCVAGGGRVDSLLGGASLDVNEGTVGFVGSPVAPADGAYGAVLADNRAGGRVECVRAGGVVDENVGEVDRVLSGGVVNGLRGGGEVGSLAGRVGYLGGPYARVRNMGGSAGKWAEISLVRCSASVNEGGGARERPVVGFVGPYSRISFETSSAEEALASIGRVDRGALEAGLVDIRYGGRMGESLLPLLREREGLSVGE